VIFRRFFGGVAADSRSSRFDSYVRMQHFIRRSTSLSSTVLGDVRREFLQRVFAALHGTLDSYLRATLHEGSADVVACLLVPRA
jgi:hypothetical protein